MARKLIVEIIGDDRSLQKALGRSNKAASGFASTLGKVGKAAAFTAGGAAIGGLAIVLKRGGDELADAQRQNAQTAAALKSTGKVAGVTAKQVTALATAISKKTGIDDQAIQASENMLLTFTDIRNAAGKNNKIFDQATQAVADVATRMNNGAIPSAEQLSKTSIQLGKALNDPIKGVGALSRIGVTFTDKQKKLIKRLVETAHKSKAQLVILKELRKEFGGSAKAAGDTLPGQLAKLRNAFDDVSAKVVARLLPALTRVLAWVNRHWPQISRTFEVVADAIGVSIRTAVRFIRPIVDYIRQHWPEISRTIKNVATTIKAIWTALWPTVSKVVKVAVATIIPLIRSIAQIIRGVVQIISGILHGDWSKVWTGLKNVAGGAIKGIKTIIVAQTKILGILALKLGQHIKNMVVQGLEGLAGLIRKGFTAALNWVIDKINAVISAFNKIPLVPNIPKVPKIGEQPTGPKATPRPVQKTPSSGPFGLPSNLPSAGNQRTPQVTHVHIDLDGREIANVLIPQMQRRKKTGVSQRRGRYGGESLIALG